MRTLARSTLIFAASALAGPFIRLVAWPPSRVEAGSSMRDFVYDLVLLLWPTQPLAVIEASVGTSVGTFLTVAISVGSNILLFAVAGLVAGISATQPLRLLAVYLVVCVMVLILALWSAGSFEHLNMVALLVVFILYALPFWVVFRLTATGRQSNA